MERTSSSRRPGARRSAPLVPASLSAAALLAAAACAGSSSPAGVAPASTASSAMRAPTPDPRPTLRGGWFDAQTAGWNMRLVSNTRPSEKFINPSTPGDRRLVNSDLAFSGHYVFQGNYSGYQVWDIANPVKPVLATSYVCPGSQSDVSVYKNLMFVSAEAVTGRTDCGMQGVPDTSSPARARGIRIFDITDVRNPKPITIVQTCRGSHTNTLVSDPKDAENIYVYVSGSAGVRPASELAGCSGLQPNEDPNTALFRIEVIKVPLAHPEQAAIVSHPRIFADTATGDPNGLKAVPRHAESAEDVAEAARARAASGRPAAGPALAPNGGRLITQCHDITTYPAVGLAGGACLGMGLLLDIRDVANPKRIDAAADSNFSAWHSATFSNDGSKVLFSDEWGGGSQPRCRATDKMEWGADAIFTIENGKMKFQSYYKMPAAQSSLENCVSHNGSLIPIPGRDIMVQAFYQGGITVFEFTDPAHPREIGYFDRGPMDPTKFVDAGYWSVYWYNGYIIGSEITRGMDILELTPGALISKNEIEAAKTVQFDFLNVQHQPKLVWPASFALARAYLDQLVRDNGIASPRSAAIAQALDAAEKQGGSARKAALTLLAAQLDGDAASAKDQAKVRLLAGAVKDLAAKG